MFKIEVYDKRNHPVEPFFWISSIISMVLLLVGFVIDSKMSRPSSVIFLDISLPFLAIAGVLGIILKGHRYGSVGDISYLTVGEDYIHFLDNKLSLSNVDKIVIRLPADRIQHNWVGNNYLEIKTQDGNTYKLGVLISGSKHDEAQIEGIMQHLKSKVENFSYHGYL